MKVWELKVMLGKLDDYMDVEVDGREIDTVKRITKPRSAFEEFTGRVVVNIRTHERARQ